MQIRLSGATLQTLVLLWSLTWMAIFLMMTRLIMRRVRKQTIDTSDKLTMVAMICLLSRLAFVHVALMWGTNNVPQSFRTQHQFSQTDIYQREIGSKFILISRLFYNTYLWLQKCVVLLLYKRILGGVKNSGAILKAYWVILVTTYAVVQTLVFTDCTPVYLYWQVVPDPGVCVEAIGELLILGGLNIFTDILLIILPLPSLLPIRSSFGAKLRLLSLFCLGFFLVIITVIRLPFNFRKADMQGNRVFWSSIESFTAAFVANIPTLYTLRKTLPNKPSVAERLSGVGWMEAGDKSLSHDEAKKQPNGKRGKRDLFIIPDDDEVAGSVDRKARISKGKVEYIHGGEKWEDIRCSVDSYAIFNIKA